MRVTEKLLLGIACSALCLTMAGCSDDNDHPSNITKEYKLGTVAVGDQGILLVSNGQGDKGSDEITITSSALPGQATTETQNDTETENEAPNEDGEAKLDSQGSADPHGLTHKLIEQSRELLKAKATQTKVLAKESFTPNTRYTTLAKGEDIEMNVDFDFNGKTKKATFRKVLDSNETESVLVFAEVDPETDDACIDETKALEIDKMFGEANPYDDEGKAIGKRVRDIFGGEWRENGGRDGEKKVIIMVCKNMKEGLFGYFDPKDAFSKEDSKYSNEGEILYLNGTISDFELYSTIAHEFQHMCDFNQKTCLDGEFSGEYEETSINEGKSTLAEDLCGFKMIAEGENAETKEDEETKEHPSNGFLVNVVSNYLANPQSVSLVGFSNDPREYGQAYLLMRYITDHCGVDKLNGIATSPYVGFDNIGEITSISFDKLYYYFGITNLLSNRDNAPKDYSYTSIDLSKNYLNGKGEAVSLGWATPTPITQKSKNYDIYSRSNNYYSITYPSLEKDVVIGLSAPLTSESGLPFFKDGLFDKIY